MSADNSKDELVLGTPRPPDFLNTRERRAIGKSLVYLVLDDLYQQTKQPVRVTAIIPRAKQLGLSQIAPPTFIKRVSPFRVQGGWTIFDFPDRLYKLLDEMVREGYVDDSAATIEEQVRHPRKGTVSAIEEAIRQGRISEKSAEAALQYARETELPLHLTPRVVSIKHRFYVPIKPSPMNVEPETRARLLEMQKYVRQVGREYLAEQVLGMSRAKRIRESQN